MVRFKGKDEPYPAAEPNGLRLHILNAACKTAYRP